MARQRSRFGKKPKAMLRYKSRNMPNAKSRRGPRLRRNLTKTWNRTERNVTKT